MKNAQKLIGVLFFLVLAVILGIPSTKDYLALKTAPDLKDIKQSDYKEGMMVKGETDTVWACYCSETNDGKEVNRWYLVPSDDSFDYDLIGVKVNSKLFSDYEAVYNSYWNWADGKAESKTKSITYQGRIKKVDGEVAKHLKQSIKDWGLSSYEDRFLLYYIELKTTKLSITNMILSAVFLGIAIVFLILAVISGRRDKAFEKEREEINNNTPLWNNGISLVIDDQELERIELGGKVVNEETPDTAQADDAAKPDDGNDTIS